MPELKSGTTGLRSRPVSSAARLEARSRPSQVPSKKCAWLCELIASGTVDFTVPACPSYVSSTAPRSKFHLETGRCQSHRGENQQRRRAWWVSLGSRSGPTKSRSQTRWQDASGFHACGAQNSLAFFFGVQFLQMKCQSDRVSSMLCAVSRVEFRLFAVSLKASCSDAQRTRGKVKPTRSKRAAREGVVAGARAQPRATAGVEAKTTPDLAASDLRPAVGSGELRSCGAHQSPCSFLDDNRPEDPGRLAA